MVKSLIASRALAGFLVAAAVGGGVVATAGGAEARPKPPAEAKQGCFHDGVYYRHRAVIEHNGSWYECNNGSWVRFGFPY